MRRQLSKEELEHRLATTTNDQRRSYYRRILNGLCTNCNSTPVPGRRRCEVCELKNLESVERLRRKINNETGCATRREYVAKLEKQVAELQAEVRRARRAIQKADREAVRGYWPEIHGPLA